MKQEEFTFTLILDGLTMLSTLLPVILRKAAVGFTGGKHRR
jgi:hypothetical protein